MYNIGIKQRGGTSIYFSVKLIKQKMMKKIMKKETNGITLIALVVTIVVLLILAGVSINMVLGQNGIVTKAKDARDKTEQAKQNDLASMDQAVKDIDDILNDGESPSVDWNEILKKADEDPNQFRDQEQQSTNKDIGIGTDGKAVNLDRWNYDTDPDNGVATLRGTQGNGCGNPGYVGKIENGRIIGKVPQYIKKDGEDAWCEVRNLLNTFCYCEGLVIAPEIPSDATNMSCTFVKCTSLTTAPKIPDGVSNMSSTFFGCESLTTAPKIPDGVTDMRSTFDGCTSLTTAPKIPDGITDMSSTFEGCTSLTTAPKIPDGVSNMSSTFFGCTRLTTAPKIPDGVTDMNRTFVNCEGLTIAPEIPEGVRDMALTFSGCVNLTTAPTIPSRVTNIAGTFYSCKKLTGVVINAEQLTANSGGGYYRDNNGYTDCFFGTELPITLKGTSPYLERIAADYSNVTVAQ